MKMRKINILLLLILAAGIIGIWFVEGLNSENQPELRFQNLRVKKSKIISGNTVTVSIEVTNMGKAEDNQTIYIRLNGEDFASESVHLEAGESKTLEFELKKEEPGDYSVSVGNLRENFRVYVPPTSSVRIENGQLSVGGKPFQIRGVCYSPVPVGRSVGGSYNWYGDPSIYLTDFPMIEDTGANTIRVYDASRMTENFLNAAYEHGLRVIMGYWVDWSKGFSDPKIRKSIIQEFVRLVDKWENHPAVLMWAFGNEVNSHAKDLNNWYSLLQKAAEAAHKEEGKDHHPVIAVESEIDDLGRKKYGSDDSSMSALDAWGVNAYRGKYFGSLFAEFDTMSDKPLILTEWGCDALDARDKSENQKAQAEYLRNQWKEIQNHFLIGEGNCLGGTVFEWCDEWWKAGNTSAHDNTGQWANTNYYDFIEGKNNMNEEWWGITSISSGTHEKKVRKAYQILKEVWQESESSGFALEAIPRSGGGPPGSTVKFRVDVLPKGGYSEKVALNTDNLPDGIKVSFRPKKNVPPFSSEVRVTVEPDAEPENYSIEIKGSGAGEKKQCKYKLKAFAASDKDLYSDSVPVPSGARIYRWDGSTYGGPEAKFEDSFLKMDSPEGDQCFKTTSGENWNSEVNYAGWGIFYEMVEEHSINLEEYNYLKFWVKSSHDLKVEIECLGKRGPKYAVYLSQVGWIDSNVWQKIIIPKEKFRGADFSEIYSPFLVTVEAGSSTFYVDNVRWIQ